MVLALQVVLVLLFLERIILFDQVFCQLGLLELEVIEVPFISL